MIVKILAYTKQQQHASAAAAAAEADKYHCPLQPKTCHSIERE